MLHAQNAGKPGSRDQPAGRPAFYLAHSQQQRSQRFPSASARKHSVDSRCHRVCCVCLRVRACVCVCIQIPILKYVCEPGLLLSVGLCQGDAMLNASADGWGAQIDASLENVVSKRGRRTRAVMGQFTAFVRQFHSFTHSKA